MECKRPFFVGLGVFCGLFLVSLVFYLVIAYGSVERVLFFPRENSSTLAGELRVVPDKRGKEEDIRILISELLLGPAKLDLSRVVPRGTRLNSVLLRKGVLYVDFSNDIFLGRKESELSFDEMLAAVRKTILFNFKRIKSIIISIEGQIPGSLDGEEAGRNRA
ncbi:MAG TPA: GerMN domain-containing protein [Spirochaetia bacterium]|nr:GerMN domain-containing protein [Spirochaetia bacterium]